MSFSDKVNEESKKMNTSNDWFKLEEGENKIRVLVEPEVFYEKFKTGICYTDCGYTGTPKYLTWILDEKDGKIKLFRMNLTLAKQIATYMNDEDYKFETFPMPYSIKINAKNAGTKEVEYTVIPGKENPIEEAILAETTTKKNVVEIIESMKAKQKERVDAGEIVVETKVEDKGESIPF